jgi:cell wall-associated NlpC family hydrolase
MASNPRFRRSMQAGLAATVMATTVGISAGPANAQPPPTNASDAAKQLHDLSQQAEGLAAQYQKTQDDHAAKQAELDQANRTADQADKATAQARADEDRARGPVDQMSHASYEGAHMNKLSAMLTSQSPNQFLNRASTMETLAKDNERVVTAFSNARAQAEAAARQAQDARNRAAAAEADAARIQADMGQKKAAMDAQVAKVKQQYNSLSAKEKAAMSGDDGGSVGLLGGSGAAVEATNAALGKIGSPYGWGATGPDSFDCSGLVQWAYKQAGVSLPRSTYSQETVGTSVSQSNLQPGDLIFFNGGEHVGIYIGGGKVVHAPEEGENVKTTPYQYLGSVSAMRRVAG